MLLNEKNVSRIEGLLSESIKLLCESDGDKLIVYHCSKQAFYKNIFKFGFEAFFKGKNIGNLYGRGVYTTTDLESSITNAHRGEYGNIIIKCEVFVMDKFLIWDKDIAMKVYGQNWDIRNQLKLILPPEAIQLMKNTTYSEGTLYSYMSNIGSYTSENALAFYQKSSQIKDSTGKSLYSYVDGFVFRGRRDGNVAIIKDFKNIMPLEYSTDYGQTFTVGYDKNTIKYTKNDFDVDYRYGHKYTETEPPSNGLAKVTNNQNKINYIDKEGNEVSKVWFDGGSKFDDFGDGFLLASVDYRKHLLFLTTDGQIFETPEDDYPLCDSSELPEYFNA